MMPEDPAPAIEALKTLSAYGKSKKVAVIMENRGRTAPEKLVEVMKASGTYANPDIGNFPDEETRERGLRLMYPLAVTVSHVKLNPARFDPTLPVNVTKLAIVEQLVELVGQGAAGAEPSGVQVALEAAAVAEEIASQNGCAANATTRGEKWPY